MLWRLTLAVAVVYGGGVCSSMKADVMSRLMMPRDYGVKLCGREFIRAVIFTCGGSRWKRSAEPDSDPLWWSGLGDVTVEDGRHTRQLAAQLPAGGRSDPPAAATAAASLSDLLALYGALGVGQQQPSLPQSSPLAAVLGEHDGNLAAANWAMKSKRKRNFSLGVAGKCCNQGCTKNDIGRLC